jgi:hypothetical protein
MGDEVRNEIAGGATVNGPVVQAGTIIGQIHHHHADHRRPLDLLTLRQWVEHIAADYRATVESTGDRAGAAHVRQLDHVRAGLDDSGTEPDAVRRLVIAGLVGYLARSGPPPDQPVARQIKIDLVVFSLWPLTTARKLPAGWEGELAVLTSPRLAALVEQARARRSPAEEFARAVAKRSFADAMDSLFDDLADPSRGGALLTAMALAGDLEAPPAGRGMGRKVTLWAFAIAGGAALARELAEEDFRAARLFGEVVAGGHTVTGDPLDLADLVDWLLG